jgi:homocitrate synthase NifV
MKPHKIYEHISYLAKLNLLDIEMHTHNDFGMATANAILGLEAGALSVNTTVIGLGERTGNASFEQVDGTCTFVQRKKRCQSDLS